MEILELIWENIFEIIIGVFLYRNTRQRKPNKQAEYEEKTAEMKVNAKRNRLQTLREQDKEYEQKLKNNLQEEAKLEKELGENETKA